MSGAIIVAAAKAQIADLERQFAEARAEVERQAADPGLWFISGTAPEVYLQQALRRLHAIIEGDKATVEALAVREHEAERGEKGE